MKYYTILCFLLLTSHLYGQLSSLTTPDTAYQSFQKGEALYIKGNYQEAIPFLEQATIYYGDNYDGKLIASSLYSLALLHTGQKEQAYTTFISAGALMAGNTTNNAETFVIYNLCASRYYWTYYEPTKALDLSQRIEKKLKTITSELPTSIAIELPEYLGIIKNSQGKYKEAIQYYKEAIKAAEKLPEETRNRELFKFDYFKLGELYQKTKAPYLALKTYEELEKRKKEIYQEKEEDHIELLYRTGIIKADIHAYDEALEHLYEVDKALERIPQKAYQKASVKATIGTIFLAKKKEEEAIQWNSQALKVWNSFLPPNDLRYAYKAYLNQGLLYQKDKRIGNALKWYELAATEAEKDWKLAFQNRGISILASNTQVLDAINVNLSWLSYEQAGSLISRFPKAQQMPLKIETHIAKGDLLFLIKDYARSKKHYQEALDVMQQLYPKNHPWVAEVASKLSACLLAEKNYKEALIWANKAITASLKKGVVFSGKSIPVASQIDYPLELLNAINTRGRILSGMSKQETEGTLQKVLDNYNMGIELLNQLRRVHRNEGQKYELSALTHQVCEQAIMTTNLLYTLTQKAVYRTEMMKYGELSKSAILLEFIRDLKAKQIANIPQELIHKEQQLKVALSYIQKELFYGAKDTSKVAAEYIEGLKKELQLKRKEHEVLLQQLETEHPDYYRMKYDYATTTIEELQATLNPDEALLEYMVSDSFVFVLAITKNTVYHQYKKTDVAISDDVKSLLKYTRLKNAEKFANASTKVYSIILGDELLDKLEGKKLIVIPDGALNYLPFGILSKASNVVQGEEDMIYRKLNFLIKDYPITYNYSANLFIQSKQVKHQATAKIAAWAPSFTAMKDVLKEKEIAANGIDELPAAQAEANLISTLFEGKQILADQATEYEFKQNAANFGVLHLATHGILNDRSPLFSSLILNQEKEEDGILHTYELFNMQLNADMAVLSACNSGAGRLKKGEGVISIARGFAYAGVPNIVMSTWAVSDQATKILMEYFYKNLQQGTPKDEALQQAKLAFLKEFDGIPKYQAPFFWGSFIILGNPESVTILTNNSWLDYWWVGAILIVLLLIVWKLKFNKKKRPKTTN